MDLINKVETVSKFISSVEGTAATSTASNPSGVSETATRSLSDSISEGFLGSVREGFKQGREWLSKLEFGGSPAELGILSLCGALLIYKGKLIFRAWLIIAGLFSGYSLGVELNTRYLGLTDKPAMIFPAVLALAFALLFSAGFRFSFFLAGAAGGIYLLGFISEMAGYTPESYFYFLAAVLGGSLAAGFRNGFIVVGTSLTGAFLLTDALLTVFKVTPPGFVIRSNVELFTGGQNALIVVMITVLTLLGLWLQAGRRLKRRR